MEIAAIFAQIPDLAGYDPATIDCQPLAGLTNDNYRLRGPGLDCILRLPRAETNRWINRFTEQHNLKRAFETGLAPPFRYFADNGVMLSDVLTGSLELTADNLKDDSMMQQVASALRRLHGLQPAFRGRVNLETLINRYYRMMSVTDQQQNAGAYQQARALLAELAADKNQPLVSSHNDLVLQNILCQDDRLWMIDWEYSSQASPYWDLATLCNEADFDDAQATELLSRYSSGENRFSSGQLNKYRRLLGFLSNCWLRAFHPS